MDFKPQTLVYEENVKNKAERLIYCVSFELLTICILILWLYGFGSLYYATLVVFTAGILVLFNLYLLKWSQNTLLCGHILLLILFVAILVCNFLVRGLDFSFSSWFYVIPVLSVTLVGHYGLFIYSSLSLLIIVACGFIVIPPYYSLSSHELSTINWFNHLFSFLIITNTLSNASKLSNQHEKALVKEKNKYTYLARVDALTGLPNRSYFVLQLESALNGLSSKQNLTVFFMDLDNFKTINDNYGHDAGDAVLKETARRLKDCFRNNDVVARLSGDEFTAFIIHAEHDDIAKKINEKITLAFQQPVQFKEQICHCSISIGQSTWPEQAKTQQMLMSLADASMYEAKKKKKLKSGNSFY